MGFLEVVKNIRTIFKNIQRCKDEILNEKPDALILIDYPGFNLRIAAWAKQQRIPVYYYIAPQIWAWKENRVHKIKRDVTELYAVLPFEKDFYAKKGMDVQFVGHPLLDEVNKRQRVSPEEFRKRYFLDERPIIALLPGSRKQEVTRMLNVMLEMKYKFPEHQFIIAGAPSLPENLYKEIIGKHKVSLFYNVTYDLLEASEAALVTSGTATLETALLGTPQVVCYKANTISFAIAKRLVKIKFISLVNLLLNREAVRELIQDEWNVTQAEEELRAVLIGGNKRESVLSSYTELKASLGNGGASELTASLLLKNIQAQSKA